MYCKLLELCACQDGLVGTCVCLVHTSISVCLLLVYVRLFLRTPYLSLLCIVAIFTLDVRIHSYIKYIEYIHTGPLLT